MDKFKVGELALISKSAARNAGMLAQVVAPKAQRSIYLSYFDPENNGSGYFVCYEINVPGAIPASRGRYKGKTIFAVSEEHLRKITDPDKEHKFVDKNYLINKLSNK